MYVFIYLRIKLFNPLITLPQHIRHVTKLEKKERIENIFRTDVIGRRTLFLQWNIPSRILLNCNWIYIHFFLFLMLNTLLLKNFVQFLKVTFHLQLLQNNGYIPRVVQYILELILHPIVRTSHSAPLSCCSHPPHW